MEKDGRWKEMMVAYRKQRSGGVWNLQATPRLTAWPHHMALIAAQLQGPEREYVYANVRPACGRGIRLG
jgi:hypothetical protein